MGHLIEHSNSTSQTSSASHSTKPHTMDDLVRNGLTKFPVSCIVCKQTLLRPMEVGIHAKYHCSQSSRDTSSRSSGRSSSDVRNKTRTSGSNGDDPMNRQPINSGQYASINNLAATIKTEPDDLVNNQSPSKCKLPLSTLDSVSATNTITAIKVEEPIRSPIETSSVNRCLPPMQEKPLSLTSSIVDNDDVDHQTSSSSLSSSSDAHQKNKTYQCIQCQESFATEAEIQTHVTRHMVEEGRLECQLCQRKKDSPAKLQIHLIKHYYKNSKENLACLVCRTSIETASDLQSHMFAEHISERSYSCTKCCQKFWFPTELEHHQLSEHKADQSSDSDQSVGGH